MLPMWRPRSVLNSSLRATSAAQYMDGPGSLPNRHETHAAHG